MLPNIFFKNGCSSNRVTELMCSTPAKIFAHEIPISVGLSLSKYHWMKIIMQNLARVQNVFEICLLLQVVATLQDLFNWVE